MKVHGTTKAVIIVTSADQSFYQRTLKMIIEKNNFETCVIICTAHFTILTYPGPPLSKDENSYDRLSANVLSWMNTKNPEKVI